MKNISRFLLGAGYAWKHGIIHLLHVDHVISHPNRHESHPRSYSERRSWRSRKAFWDGSASMTRPREPDGYEPRQLVYETGPELKEAVRKKNWDAAVRKWAVK